MGITTNLDLNEFFQDLSEVRNDFERRFRIKLTKIPKKILTSFNCGLHENLGRIYKRFRMTFAGDLKDVVKAF